MEEQSIEIDHNGGGVEKELLELERQYWQAMKDGDVDAALRLTHDPCIVTGAQGFASLSKNDMAGMLAQGGWQIRKFELGDGARVNLISDDVAVLAYKVHEDLVVDGAEVTLAAADASVWIKRDGRWLCALHTESLIGDPFGRDRRVS